MSKASDLDCIRSSHPDVSLGKGVQWIYRRTPIPKYEITLLHECSPVNLLHIIRTPFLKNPSEWQLLLYPSGASKELWAELSYILAELFKVCLKEYCLPDCWKFSLVVPVFKNVGERSMLLKTTALLVFFLWLVKSLKNL